MPRMKNMEGLVFGRLTVVSRAEDIVFPSGQRQVAWNCRCSCGRDKVARGSDLRDGKTSSCGCFQREAAASRIHKGMLGARFGQLVVLGKGPVINGKALWICQCACGRRKEIMGKLLRSGSAKTCGCHIGIAASGPRLEIVGYSALHRRLWVERGTARERECFDCGGRAAEWSYNGADPDERTEIVGGYPLRFSLHLDNYSPRCKPCHTRHDLQLRGHTSEPDERGVA